MPWRPGRNVLVLALVSLLTDASSEIIAPLLPVFLVGTLGTSVQMVGLIEGAAEAVAALLKVASGWWSDRVGRHKPFIVAGYGLAALVRPLMALTTSGAQVLAIRLTDRVGKGIRGAPRDALLAASTAPAFRGRAFGFHRAADHAGAVIGPLIAFIGLQWVGLSLRQLFWIAAVPGAAAVLVALVGVREQGRTDAPLPAATSAPIESIASTPGPLPMAFWKMLAPMGLFTLGNSTDAFLLLRAHQLGVATAVLPLLWGVLHVVKSASSIPGGALSDRVGRVPLIVGGWITYALVYVGFAMATRVWQAWALFAVYGVVFGLTEGTEKALVADLVPSVHRGRAFGWYQGGLGLMALPASLLFGAIWAGFGPSWAFGGGALLALAASIWMAVIARGLRGR
jgi:MFS family permease